MDINAVVGPSVSQVTREKTGEAVSAAALNEAQHNELAKAVQSVETVAQPSQEIPEEKLSSHLGRNIDVTA